MKKTGGSQYDPTDRGIYFLAGHFNFPLMQGRHKYLLTAINEFTSSSYATIQSLIDQGLVIFCDSGVYSFAMEIARAKGCNLYEVFRLPPDDLPGFNDLVEKYCKIIGDVGEKLWGYVEIDLGGVEGKRRIRAELERRGLRPIPVYHPVNDGWDYFDELASQYDRICLSNSVIETTYIRLRLLRTIEERRKKYPNLWIHILGLTPSELQIAYPLDSADSSSWLSSVRWGGYQERVCVRRFGDMPLNFRYDFSRPETRIQALTMSIFGSGVTQKNYRNLMSVYQSHFKEGLCASALSAEKSRASTGSKPSPRPRTSGRSASKARKSPPPAP